ncbi:hypothetical protein [uncultured Chryseobacterium sp.]|uniref:YncE family protein n=1 Tax=uncultured Chryseobacterium sp. TaxID=259322 RepID=UPI0025FC0536|nr:hypothetical protein [uncultured Chryseobacterium sp.]
MKNIKLKIAGLLLFLFSVGGIYGQTVKTDNNIQHIALQGKSVFPEGIITLPNNDILVGGFGDGSIQRIDRDNNVSFFSQPGQNGMVIAVGFHLDVKNNRLWVANFNFKTESGNPGSQFKVFDYNTGKLLKTIPEKFVEGAFFNEVTMNSDGKVFVSDTFGPHIWSTSFELANANTFVTNDLLKNSSPEQPFGLNGLTISPDQKYLIASVMNRTIKGGGRLIRIDLSNKNVTPIELKNVEAVNSFSGSDGMFFHKEQLIMVNVYSSAGAIFTASFNKDYSEATLQIKDKFQSVYDRPTASTIRNGKLYIVNSQLNHIIDDKDGKMNTPPILPFQVVSVPLKELLR